VKGGEKEWYSIAVIAFAHLALKSVARPQDGPVVVGVRAVAAI